MNAINYMLKQSDYTVLEDGTVTFIYKGIAYKDVVKAIQGYSTLFRSTNLETVYNGEGESFSWSLKLKRNRATFVYNDYTIPMNTK